MQEQLFRAMGCQMLAMVDSSSVQATNLLAHVPGWFADWEQHLSRFRADSELMQLNLHSGKTQHVSQVLWDVVEAALQAAERSDGLVTPTMLRALEAAGYDRSFETLEAGDHVGAPTHADVADWHAITRDAAQRTIQLPAGVELDLGGIAKGWAADTAAGMLSVVGPTLVDAGGDIAVSGPCADGQPWEIGVADPFEPERDRAVLCISQGGVATSGRDYRRWQRNGMLQHHILDPRTGRPAHTDVVSATVIAPSTREAEMAAKVALICGSREGVAWIDARPHLAALLILENGNMLLSQRIKPFLL